MLASGAHTSFTYYKTSLMIADYDIGLAVPGEAAAIARLSRDIVEYGMTWGWTPRRVLARHFDRSTNVVVARSSGIVIGFALMEYSDDYAHLLLLGVAPNCQRRGIASALLAWLEATLRVAGIVRILAEVRETNEGARAFYQSRGFEEYALTPGYYQKIENSVHLSKVLNVGGASFGQGNAQ